MSKLLFAINVGWYFDLHWKERVNSPMTEGFDIHLCMSKPTDSDNEKLHNLSLTRSSIGILDNLKTLYQSYKIFKKVNPDVIHSVTIKPNLMFGIIALFYRKPILLTIPGLGSMFSQVGMKSKLIASMIISLYRIIGLNQLSAFIFENKTDMNLFLEKNICTQENAFTVPGSGVNIDEYNAPAIDTKSNDGLKLLFAARLLKGKGLYELVNVVASLKDNGNKVTLNVAGIIDDDSNEAIPLSQLTDWDEKGAINWLGQINGGMSEVISQNDAIVLPTRYGEGLPRILIEANACRRPVITTNIGGCSDFVINGSNGILVQACDSKELECAIVSLMDKNFSAQLGLNGRSRVEQYYTDEHVIKCYLNIYRIQF